RPRGSGGQAKANHRLTGCTQRTSVLHARRPRATRRVRTRRRSRHRSAGRTQAGERNDRPLHRRNEGRLLTRSAAQRGATWLIVLLGAAVFLNYVDRGAIGIAAPVMKKELGLSAEAYGIAFSAFFWIYAPVQLVTGWLCDRISVYKLMAAGILLWAASTL